MYLDHEKWNNKIYKPLIKLVNIYRSYISMKHLDFPYRWKSMLKYRLIGQNVLIKTAVTLVNTGDTAV